MLQSASSLGHKLPLHLVSRTTRRSTSVGAAQWCTVYAKAMIEPNDAASLHDGGTACTRVL
jgi:hypothetical protein